MDKSSRWPAAQGSDSEVALAEQGPEVVAALKRARERVARAWRKGGGDRYGDPGEPCQCALGALRAETTVTVGYVSALFFPAARVLRAAIQPTDSIAGWNDAPGRTQDEVLAAFDRAIALASNASAPTAPPETP